MGEWCCFLKCCWDGFVFVLFWLDVVEKVIFGVRLLLVVCGFCFCEIYILIWIFIFFCSIIVRDVKCFVLLLLDIIRLCLIYFKVGNLN